MTSERRISERVKFGHGISVRMMALDGTWSRKCSMQDVSEVGARLVVEGSFEGLDLKEFYLVLSTIGQAHRRCSMVWVSDSEIGVSFIRPELQRGAKPSADAMVE